DGTKLVSAGADKAARVMDLNTGQTVQVAAHDGVIRCTKFVEVPGAAGPVVVTGGWDKTVRYWDMRAQNPILNVALPERCYTMDATGPLLVVGTAERHVMIYNLANPSAAFK
ncbi:hypothetical protein HK405_000762, partial [Cladochytrium tenue]